MNAMRTHAATMPRATSKKDGFIALDACHRKTLAMLEELSTLITELEGSGYNPQIREQASRIAAFFSTEAREHHVDEERHVFPALVESGKPDIVQAVMRLQQDHDWLEEDWFDLAPHVLALASGRSPWDIASLREGAAALTALYHDHIKFEESFIYPEAQSLMVDKDRLAMAREMAARHRADRAARRRE